MPVAYRIADIFVLPPYYEIEAQPRSIIEALNSATPVISTRHASIPEYVFDDRNGYLVNKRAPEEIAHAIQKLVDVDNWQKKAQLARKTYMKMFDTHLVKKKLMHVFRQEN